MKNLSLPPKPWRRLVPITTSCSILLLLLFSCNNAESEMEGLDENKKDSSIQKPDGYSGETTMNASWEANLTTEGEHVLSLLDLSETIPDTLLGAFGDQFYRIDLFFNQLKKEYDSVYVVEGQTKLRNKTESFKGGILVKHIFIMDSDIYDKKDSEFRLITVESRFIFEEENGGRFLGKLILSLHQNKKDESFDFDLFDWMQDGYINYEFIGDWTKENQKDKVYFSEGRMNIELDGGCAEGFCPKQEYIKNGWEDYYVQ